MLGHGSPYLRKEDLDGSNVELVVHTRGSIRKYVDFSVFDLGIKVTSNSYVIAPFVAEFTLGLMVLAARRTHLYSKYVKEEPGNRKELPRQYPFSGKKLVLSVSAM